MDKDKSIEFIDLEQAPAPLIRRRKTAAEPGPGSRDVYYRRVREACLQLHEPSQHNLTSLLQRCPSGSLPDKITILLDTTRLLRRGVLPVPSHLESLRHTFQGNQLPEAIELKVQSIKLYNRTVFTQFAVQQLLSQYSEFELEALVALGMRRSS